MLTEFGEANISASDFENIDIFGRFDYPNLKELDIRHSFYDNQILGVMLRNAKNLEVLKYDNGSADIGNVVLDRLQTLVAGYRAALAFLIGRVPILKYLELEYHDAYNTSTRNFNDFISQCPLIETIKCDCLEAQHAFWRLDLRHLFISYFEDNSAPNGNLLLTIGQVFHNLETLELERTRFTKDGIMALAACKNLRRLKLKGYFWFGEPLDDGIRELRHCHRLEMFQIDEGVHAETLIAIVNECRELKVLTIISIKDIVSPDEAVDVIQSFRRFGPDLTIRIISQYIAQIWISDQVKLALTKPAERGYSLVQFQHGGFI